MNNETRASESVTSGSRGPSRRTLVRTAAWSVPVISTAAAAPAFAAASDVFTVSSSAEFGPGRNSVIVTVTIANPAGGQLPATGVVLSIGSITASGGTQPVVSSAATPTGWTGANSGLPYQITYGSSITNGNSTTVIITFNFSSKPDNKQTVAVSGSVSVPNFNPNSLPVSATAA